MISRPLQFLGVMFPNPLDGWRSRVLISRAINILVKMNSGSGRAEASGWEYCVLRTSVAHRSLWFGLAGCSLTEGGWFQLGLSGRRWRV